MHTLTIASNLNDIARRKDIINKISMKYHSIDYFQCYITLFEVMMLRK